jgi:hypothetical protein
MYGTDLGYALTHARVRTEPNGETRFPSRGTHMTDVGYSRIPAGGRGEPITGTCMTVDG